MIVAGQDTECYACGAEIDAGEQMGLVGGEWCCEFCVECAGGEDDEEGTGL